MITCFLTQLQANQKDDFFLIIQSHHMFIERYVNFLKRFSGMLIIEFLCFESRICVSVNVDIKREIKVNLLYFSPAALKSRQKRGKVEVVAKIRQLFRFPPKIDETV